MDRKKPLQSPSGQPRPRVSWVDERQNERGNMRVQQGFAAMRAERVYEEAAACADCQAARLESGDDALCDVHMAQALGMSSDWL